MYRFEMTSSHRFDAVVVGAGIGGLYAAYTYQRSHPERTVCVLERSAYVGGRVRTKMFAGAKVTQGAGVGRARKDRALHNLLRKLGVPHRSHPMQIGYASVAEYDVGAALARLEAAAPDIRSPVTFRSFATSVLGAADYKRFVDRVGYTDFEDADALYTLKHYGFEDTYNSDMSAKTFLDWDDLVDKISSGLEIFRKCNVRSVDPERKRVVCADGTSFTAKDRLVLAVPASTLRSLFPSKYQCVQGQPFTYVYAQLSADSTLPASGYTVVPAPLRKVIPMDPSRRVYMIGYADNADALVLRSKKDPAFFERELRRAFPTSRVKIEKMWHKHWAAGTHFFHPYFPASTTRALLHRLQNPHPNVTVVGEAVSEHQGWVEGALQSVHRAGL